MPEMEQGHNQDIFLACVNLHDMMINDEADLSLEFSFDNRVGTNLRRGPSLDAYKHGTDEMENSETYFILRMIIYNYFSASPLLRLLVFANCSTLWLQY